MRGVVSFSPMSYLLLFPLVSTQTSFPSRQESATSLSAPRTNFQTAARLARFLSVFTVHQFVNAPCLLNSGDIGTCFTVTECDQLGGSGGGWCAGGYGICCALFATCDSLVTRNNTHFVNARFPETDTSQGVCAVRLPAATESDDEQPVCQLRLNFQQLQLSPPDPADHQCLQQQLIITAGGGRHVRPLVICGNNTGQHVYVDFDDTLDGNEGVVIAINRPSSAKLTWIILIQRIPCGATYSAPPGCTQYYTDLSGRFTSFNFHYERGAMISDLQYSICIRRSAGRCGLSLRQCEDRRRPPSTFSISGHGDSAEPRAVTGDLCVSDWLEIGCGTDRGVPPYHVTTAGYACTSRFCGGWLHALDGAAAAGTVFTFVQPFIVRVHTNSREAKDTSSVDKDNRGFCIQYAQVECDTL